MRAILLMLCLIVAGCKSASPEPQPSPSYPENENNIMVCVHKYDANLGFKFIETNVRVYQKEMFGTVVRIYEIYTTDGQVIHLNEAQRHNFNCFYPR